MRLLQKSGGASPWDCDGFYVRNELKKGETRRKNYENL
jgi:hypothetical protein